MKDMRLFKKYFTKNESLFGEAARAHVALLSKHKRIVGGLEKDVNILTEGLLQTLGKFVVCENKCETHSKSNQLQLFCSSRCYKKPHTDEQVFLDNFSLTRSLV